MASVAACFIAGMSPAPLRKLKGVSMLNTVEALGIVPGHSGEAMEIDRILALWGPDPVHPTPATYRILANKIVEKVENLLLDTMERDPAGAQPYSKRKPDQRTAGLRDPRASPNGWSAVRAGSEARLRAQVANGPGAVARRDLAEVADSAVLGEGSEHSCALSSTNRLVM